MNSGDKERKKPTQRAGGPPNLKYRLTMTRSDKKRNLFALTAVIVLSLTGCGPSWTYWTEGESWELLPDAPGLCAKRLPGLVAHVGAVSVLDKNEVRIIITVENLTPDTLTYDLSAFELTHSDAKLLWYSVSGAKSVTPLVGLVVVTGETRVCVAYDRPSLPQNGLFEVALGMLRDAHNNVIMDLGIVEVDLTRYSKHYY